MSKTARDIQNTVYNHHEYIMSNPDQKLLDWIDVEYRLFQALEYARYKDMITHGFSSVEDFISTANQVLNRRKSRAGKSLEHHLAAIFDGNKLQYQSQVVTEGNKKPDFLFPSHEAYHDKHFPTVNLFNLLKNSRHKSLFRSILN